jgi:peptidoglycan/LPS O-acetylase OafA/YrhL
VSTPAVKPQRYPYLDVLRALAVLLLVFFHATGYLLLRRETGDTGLEFRWIVHVFHMPLFFVLSGFVLGIATRRSGIAKQVSSRWKRLAVPFLVAMVTVIPAINLVNLYFTSLKPETPHRAAARITFGNLFSLRPQHLWFLEYLFYLSLIALGLWWLWRRYGSAEAEKRWRAPLLVALIVVPLVTVLFDGGWEAAYQPDTMVPDVWLSLYYLCFLAAGWLISTEDGWRTSLERAPGTKLLVGGALMIAGYSTWRDHAPNLPSDLTFARLFVVFAGVAAAWLVISGLWGLSARLFAHPGKRMKQFSDSSYWMYIVHLPILVFIESELARTSLPLLLRWGLAISITALSCVVSYHLLVKDRALGRLLGERPAQRNVSKPQESFASVGAAGRGPDSHVEPPNETEPGSDRAGVRARDGARTAPP